MIRQSSHGAVHVHALWAGSRVALWRATQVTAGGWYCRSAAGFVTETAPQLLSSVQMRAIPYASSGGPQ
jgi:hypothetical protein